MSSITYGPTIRDFVKSQPDTGTSFVKFVDKHAETKIPHEALYRAWNRTRNNTTFPEEFADVWNRQLRDDYNYVTEIASRMLTVHDDFDCAAALVLVWHNKYGLEPDESQLVVSLAMADEATQSGREAFRRMEGKIKREKAEKRKMKNTEKKKVTRPPKTKTTKPLIKAALKEAPGTPAEIADRLQMDRKVVIMQLLRMSKHKDPAKIIAVNNNGVYSLIESAVMAPVNTKPVQPKLEPIVSAPQETRTQDSLTAEEKKELFHQVKKRHNIDYKQFERFLVDPYCGVVGMRQAAGLAK
jgi:hypothetical protein